MRGGSGCYNDLGYGTEMAARSLCGVEALLGPKKVQRGRSITVLDMAMVGKVESCHMLGKAEDVDRKQNIAGSLPLLRLGIHCVWPSLCQLLEVAGTLPGKV